MVEGDVYDEDLHAWARGAFRPARLTGSAVELRREGLERRQPPTSFERPTVTSVDADDLVAAAGVLAVGVVIGVTLKRVWKGVGVAANPYEALAATRG